MSARRSALPAASSVVEREDAGESAVAVRSRPHGIRSDSQITREAPGELDCQRRERVMPAPEPDELGLQLEQPRPAVRPFEGRAAGRIEERELLRDRRGCEVLCQNRFDLVAFIEVGIKPQQPHEHPVHVHGRMPVVASIKGRMQRARPPFGIRRGEQLVQPARIFALHVRGGDAGERRSECAGQHGYSLVGAMRNSMTFGSALSDAESRSMFDGFMVRTTVRYSRTPASPCSR